MARESASSGEYMYDLAQELFPINRSLSGQGVRDTLTILGRELPQLKAQHFTSGSKAFDWEVPSEWHVTSATLIDPSGRIVCDYAKDNLSLVGYSTPIEAELSLDELQPHLFSLPNQPEATPYITSYYEANWGFCMPHSKRKEMAPGKYKVKIDTTLFSGRLDYGELFIPGISEREVFFSTYICHPSMANNELSGPVLSVALAQYIQSIENYYSYRFLFLPETIGSLAYMSKNLSKMKEEIVAGYVLTCVGDNRTFSYVPSRSGDSVADRMALRTLRDLGINYVGYSWMDRGSDERQYCSPGADLPICSVTRSKYGEFIEYHTNLDVLGEVVTKQGLQGSFDLYVEIIENLERERFPRASQVGEPQLGRRGMYPGVSTLDTFESVKQTINILTQCDGTKTVGEISSGAGVSEKICEGILSNLHQEGLIKF